MINLYVYFYRADSFTWNPHKLMSVHLQCSAILLRHSVCRIEKFSGMRDTNQAGFGGKRRIGKDRKENVER